MLILHVSINPSSEKTDKEYLKMSETTLEKKIIWSLEKDLLEKQKGNKKFP
jgi:hypothetical protein